MQALAARSIWRDIGAGTGYLSRRMARAVAPSGRVLAVDVQPEMVALLERNPQLPLDRVDDVAVAAAAVMVGGRPLWETDPAELDLLWDVDVKGVWHTAAAAVPAMLDGPDPSGCRFVAVASAAGSHGLYRLAGYTAVKHAVVGLVKGLAADLVGTGVTAVAVSPGSTRTAMLEQTAAIYATTTDDLVSHQLLGRVIEPEEMAATIAFCASRDAAVLHGSVVSADGGFGA